MRDRKLASRYARALLSLVDGQERRRLVADFLAALGAAIEEHDELRTAMRDPAIPRSARKDALRSIAVRHDMPKEVGSFLATLVDRNRVSALPSIAKVFDELQEQEAGIVAAEVTTATPLADEQRERVRNTLEKLTGKRIRLTCRVEPSLLGGVVTRVSSRLYDGSLRSQLERLRRRMTQGTMGSEAR